MYQTHSGVNDAVLADTIVAHVSNTAQRDRLYANLLNELSQYNWRNSIMDTLIATGMETLEVWSVNRRAPKEALLMEVVNVICDIQSVVSAKRNQALLNALSHYEHQAIASISQMGIALNNEIEAFYAQQQSRSGYVSPLAGSHQTQVNPRYSKAYQAEIRSQPAQQPTAHASGTSARYRTSTATEIIPNVTPVTDPNKRHYVVNNKGTTPMSQILSYENHRRETFNARPSDRKPETDFMGALARTDVVNATENGIQINDSEVTKIATDVVATCRTHAQSIYSAMITDAGNTISANAVLEYSFDKIRCLRTVSDESSLQMALLNDSRLVDLRDIKSDLNGLAVAIKSLVTDSVSEMARVVGRHLNLIATEQINRLLAYDLEVSWTVPDFQASWFELRDELYKDFGQESIDEALALVSEDIITRIGTVFAPTVQTAEDLCESIDAIYQRPIATRSIFTVRHVHVTHVPANLSHLNLTFEAGTCFVDPTKAPELYDALVALENRMEGKMRQYSEILLVTEDEVELEIVPTHIDTLDQSGRKQYVIKLRTQ